MAVILQPQVFAVVPADTTPADDDAVSAYAAMDKEVVALSSSLELGSPILPCQDPQIEVTVLDDDNAPLASVPYRLLLEGSTLAEGTLDANGYAAVPKQELPAGDWNIEITLERNETTQLVERADILLTAAPPSGEEGEDDQEQVEDEEWMPFLDEEWPWH